MMKKVASDTARTRWILLLLVAGLASIGMLAYRALRADRSHREAAEGVLRDYAAMVGDEALRRVSAELGYYGYAQAIGLLRRWRTLAPGGAPAVADLRRIAAGRELRAVELIRRTFVYDPDTPLMTVSEEAGSIPIANLGTEIAARLETLPEDAGFGSLAYDLDGSDLGGGAYLVFSALKERPSREEDAGRSSGTIVGFEVDTKVAAQRIAQVIRRSPLLPRSLAAGSLGNDNLYLRIIDGMGRVLYSTGQTSPADLRSNDPYAVDLRVRRSLPADYQEVMPGLAVEAAIDPQAAGKLIIGGIPRSGLPSLLGLTLMVTGLLAAAVFLLRRERALARLRTEFVSRVSHELRTPLTQIRMFAETLRLDRVRSDEEREKSLEIIDRESRRLSALVENVLQFSRSERGPSDLTPSAFEIAPFFEDLTEEFEPLLPPGSRLLVEAEPGTRVFADRDALHQAVLNLLDNAVKYGAKRQEIRLGASVEQGKLRLWVEDQGPGIPRRDRNRVWQPFHRAANGRDAVAGTGIGLAVVHELVVAHGGICYFEDAQSSGTRVVLELPPSSGSGETNEPGGRIE